MIAIIAAISFLASAVLSVVTVHRGASLAVLVLGRANCLAPDAVNGCDWWPMSTLISTAVVLGAASPLGYCALLLVPTGPVLCILLISLWLRFGQQAARKRQFRITEGQVIESGSSGRRIFPHMLVLGSGYYQTGPATGYCLYSLTIHDQDGSKYTNGYLSTEEWGHAVAVLTQDIGCLAMTLTFESREGLRFRAVTLGQQWAELLCGELSRLSEGSRNWWRQWLQPAFGLLGSRVVSIDEVRGNLDAIEEQYAEVVQSSERIRSDCQAIRRLLETASAPIRISTPEAQSQAAEAIRGKGYFLCRNDGGVWVEELKQRS